MNAKTDQGWKQHSPCRGAGDPRLFEVPDAATPAEWARAEEVAARFCAGCPFLATACAQDPDGKWGIWSGSARWVRGSEVLFRKLIPGAPRPPFTNARNVTPEPSLRESRPSRKRAAA